MRPATALARLAGLTVYDALYLALARARGAMLLTGDARLETAATTTAPLA